MTGYRTRVQAALAICCVSLALCSTARSAGADSYDDLVQLGTALVRTKSPEAQTPLRQAIALNPLRYEAHVLLATSLLASKSSPEALAHLQTALYLAPEEVRPAIRRAITETKIATLSKDARRRLDAVLSVADRAARSTTADRERLLREFMRLSGAFLKDHPDVADLWVFRAQAAIELEYPAAAWAAGRKVRQLGLETSDNPQIRNLFARLQRKGWLIEEPPAMTPDELAGVVQAARTVGPWRCTKPGDDKSLYLDASLEYVRAKDHLQIAAPLWARTGGVPLQNDFDSCSASGTETRIYSPDVQSTLVIRTSEQTVCAALGSRPADTHTQLTFDARKLLYESEVRLGEQETAMRVACEPITDAQFQQAIQQPVAAATQANAAFADFVERKAISVGRIRVSECNLSWTERAADAYSLAEIHYVDMAAFNSPPARMERVASGTLAGRIFLELTPTHSLWFAAEDDAAQAKALYERTQKLCLDLLRYDEKRPSKEQRIERRRQLEESVNSARAHLTEARELLSRLKSDAPSAIRLSRAVTKLQATLDSNRLELVSLRGQ